MAGGGGVNVHVQNECIRINFDFTVHSLSQKPQIVFFFFFFIKNIYHKKSTQGNRIGVAPFLQGEPKN